MGMVTVNCPLCGACFGADERELKKDPTCQVCGKELPARGAVAAPADLAPVSPQRALPPAVPLRAPQPMTPRAVPAMASAQAAAAPGPGAPSAGTALHPAFRGDKFLFRQKRVAINEKYYVDDANGQPALFIERPAHLLRSLAAIFAALVAFSGGMGGSVYCLQLLGPVLKGLGQGATAAAGMMLFSLPLVLTLATFLRIYPKRHISFFLDDSKAEKLLEVLQDQKWVFLNATYTVLDTAGQPLARLRKNYLFDFFRKRWHGETMEGRPLFLVQEDSMILSLLRRFLGPLFGLLRTNFIFVDQATGDVVGEFNRKLTLFDRYVLDMTADGHGKVDRRLAVATGVLLDTGERR